MIKLTGNLHADFDKVFEEYTKLRDRILGYQERMKSLQTSLKASEKSKQKQKDDYEAKIAEKERSISDSYYSEAVCRNADGFSDTRR